MRLASFRIQHFKRFETQTTVDLGPSVVAVVGPNEAGKSSLLDALEHVGRDDEFRDDEFSGRNAPQPDSIVLSARFALDASDYSALAQIPGAQQIRFYDVWKRANSDLEHFIDPPLQRRPKSRVVLRRDLGRALANARFPEEEANANVQTLRSLATDFLNGLSDLSPDESASDELIGAATHLISELDDRDLNSTPKYVQLLSERLNAFLEEEAVDALSAAALEILSDRMPQIVRLDPSAGGLPSEWSYEEDPSEALRNLLLLAGTTPEAIIEAAASDDPAHIRTVERRANDQLRSRLATWEDGELSVEVHIGESAIDILPLDHSTNAFNKLADRSDGLRAYLALIAFVAREDGDIPPILLIDEAETHLHYAAQAELVRVFHRQSAAAKIIYTTHSAGCLPEDLGTSVRFVYKTDRARSALGNAYWTHGNGITPILLAMGAHALAFTPTRFAVIAEGPSDALLLPSMLRAASGLELYEPLGFQIAPGVASVPPRDVPGLDLEAARVVYLVDGDTAGGEHARKLVEAGIAEKRVLHLGGENSGLSTEDLLDEEIYLQAVEYVATRASRALDVSGIRPLPAQGRAKHIEDWAAARNLSVSKTLVAQEVLALHQHGTDLLDRGQSDVLRELRNDVGALFEARRR